MSGGALGKRHPTRESRQLESGSSRSCSSARPSSKTRPSLEGFVMPESATTPKVGATSDESLIGASNNSLDGSPDPGAHVADGSVRGEPGATSAGPVGQQSVKPDAAGFTLAHPAALWHQIAVTSADATIGPLHTDQSRQPAHAAQAPAETLQPSASGGDPERRAVSPVTPANVPSRLAVPGQTDRVSSDGYAAKTHRRAQRRRSRSTALGQLPLPLRGLTAALPGRIGTDRPDYAAQAVNHHPLAGFRGGPLEDLTEDRLALAESECWQTAPWPVQSAPDGDFTPVRA